jgi:hypothetical protein
LPSAGADLNADKVSEGVGRAVARSQSDVSAIVDLGGQREARVQKALPNTNLIVAKTLVPQLRGEIPAGTTVLITAALALPAGAAAGASLDTVPAAPDLGVLEALIREEGIEVTAIQVAERF